MIRFVGSQMPLYCCRVRSSLIFSSFSSRSLLINCVWLFRKLTWSFSITILLEVFSPARTSTALVIAWLCTAEGQKTIFFEHFLLYLQGPCALSILYSQLCWERSRDIVWSSYHADQVYFILYDPAKGQEGFMVARNGSTLGAGALWNSGKGSSCCVRNFGAEEVPVWWKALPCWRCSIRFCLWSNLGVSTKSFCRAHGQDESSESSETCSANEGAVFSRLGWYHFKET